MTTNENGGLEAAEQRHTLHKHHMEKSGPCFESVFQSLQELQCQQGTMKMQVALACLGKIAVSQMNLGLE